jgi:ABC-2 type transport system permease protein
MVGALLFLRLTSLRNLAVQRIRRLRQPKYLLGAAVAVGYFYYFFFRRLGMSGAASALGSPDAKDAGVFAADLICALLCLMALIRIAYAWIAPAEKPGLNFSDAEIAFLFPAPISRKTLIHYRLLSSQFAILFSALVITVVFNRGGSLGGHRLLRAIGWWLILSIIDLHLNGTKLTLARLRERSAHFVLWRVVVVGAIVLYVAAVAWAAKSAAAAYVPGSEGPMRAAGLLVARLQGSPAFRWLTLPFRIVLGPYFATGYREFAVAMVPAGLLLALHYAWVSNSGGEFGEGSIALAEKKAAFKAAALRGETPRLGGAKPRPSSGPFPLAPVGPPEIAFLWKNLLSMRSVLFSRRALYVLIGVSVWLSIALKPLLMRHDSVKAGAVGIMVVVICAIVSGYTLLLGPQLARQDLRNDLPSADLLKTYPLEGWRLALGELLAPTAILTAVLWVCVLASAGFVDAAGGIEWLTAGVRITVVACLAVSAPLLCLIQLIVPNTIMVLMPGWYQSSRSRTAGVEMFGQRLLFGLFQLLCALLVVVPAGLAAWLIIFSSKWVIGVGPAVVLAAVVVLPVLAGEAAVGLWFLGGRFERFDLSAESK